MVVLPDVNERYRLPHGTQQLPSSEQWIRPPSVADITSGSPARDNLDRDLFQCVLSCTPALPPAHPKLTVDEVEYGRASGRTLSDAKERAASITLRALMFQCFRQRTGMLA